MTDPLHAPLATESLAELIDLVRNREIVVLAGAGCSTESGIPDYRGPQGSLRTRQPMRYQEFVATAENRARYWSRSAVGWTRISTLQPNPTHFALAELEGAGHIRGIITQNVDGLHHRAGSRRVVELHGSLAAVRCLDCGAAEDREGYQRRIRAMNPLWEREVERAGVDRGAESAPDGDVELPPWTADQFSIPACLRCDGIIKPDVVFFGENVPADRVESAWRLYEEADVLLVLGSSLTVYSGRRFVYRAVKDQIPIAVVNIGPTRADEVAAIKVEGSLGQILPVLRESLIPNAA